jgi:hypothetical protein
MAAFRFDFHAPLHRGLIVFGVVLVFFWVAINAGPGNWLTLYRLATNGIETEGKVITIRPENHNACEFAYTVGGRSYSHWEGCHLAEGEISALVYLPSDPSVAIVRSAREDLDATIFVPFGMAVAAGVIAAVQQRWALKRAKDPSG